MKAVTRMNNRSRRLTLGLYVCVALSAAPALAAQPVPYLPVPRDAAVILNTGSTNAAGYRIVVQRDGQAEYVLGGVRKKVQLSAQKTESFFSDMSAAMPLSGLRAGHCMKSASFGSSTFVWWRGKRSPDLQCAADPKATALYSSVSKVATELGLDRVIIPPMPNEPRRPMPEPSPS
jgi:hypothetical protein